MQDVESYTKVDAMPDIGARIRELRGNMSLVKFSDKLGIHRNTLRHYESCERSPDGVLIKSLCDLYSVHADWLIFERGPKYWGEEADPPPAELDHATLVDAIDTLEQVLQATGKDMKTEDKAETIAKIYELYAEDTRGTDKEKFSNILKLVANYD